MTTGYTLEQMQAAHAEYMQDYEQLKQQCEALVVETRIGNARMICPTPLFDQIADQSYYWSVPQRRWIESEDETAMSFEHGFDKDGILRTYHGHCFFYKDDLIDEVTSGYLTRYALNAHGVAEIVYRYSDGLFEEQRFIEEAGRVTKSITKQAWLDDDDLAGHDFVDTCTYEYDQQGMLNRVIAESFRNGELLHTTLKYARPAGETLETASRSLEDFLVEQIPKVVSRYEAEVPLFAAILCYCGEDIPSGWPGYLAIATEEHRDEHINGHPDDIWMVEEWWQGSWLDVYEPAAGLEMQERALRVLQLVDSPDIWLTSERILPMRQILHRAAMRLNETDWSDIASVTDDFVVAVIDNTGDFDADEDLAASLPPEKIAGLRSNGFLHWIDQ